MLASVDNDTKVLASKEIYAALRNEIMLGQIPPETLLAESKLAKRFGVSRTPVREALRLLASEGFITALPQRGHLVRSVPLSEILDAFRLREILEVEAIGEAAARISENEIAYLRELALKRSGPDLTEVNREIHLTIARIGGNQILTEFLEKLLVSMNRVISFAIERNQWNEDKEHGDLSVVEALATHDPEKARAAMHAHIRASLSSLLRQYDPAIIPPGRTTGAFR